MVIQRLGHISNGLVYDSTKGILGNRKLISGTLIGRLVAVGANIAPPPV